MSIGLYGKGYPDYLMNVIELGERVAHWMDDENNDPDTHFSDYGIDQPNHWLHKVDMRFHLALTESELATIIDALEMLESESSNDDEISRSARLQVRFRALRGTNG